MRSYLRQILHFLTLFFRQFFAGHLIVPLLHHTVPGHFGSNGDPVIRILYLLMKSFLSVNCYLPFRPAISIDTVHYYTDHHFLFFRFGFCNHYGQSNKRMIIQSFVPCFIVELVVPSKLQRTFVFPVYQLSDPLPIVWPEEMNVCPVTGSPFTHHQLQYQRGLHS